MDSSFQTPVNYVALVLIKVCSKKIENFWERLRNEFLWIYPSTSKDVGGLCELDQLNTFAKITILGKIHTQTEVFSANIPKQTNRKVNGKLT
ncbi:hypothetical protein BIY22_08320 [Vibrio panuliri]|uniref:Uncharacterized protein n=1 Tax=Vibrio panuliri TaxID=1381081 RepID=A0A1Q9HET4_9VIBR|nr:hypothetical protein BIY22_08320 [Vibrio panuliri]OLQ94145.1 hypothetical protein BIY20_07920 [Vibrio panuliri]